MRLPRNDVELARHIIEFNPDDPATYAAWTIPQALVMSSVSLQTIPWPKASAPRPAPMRRRPRPEAALPKADCLVVTWTVAEGHALSDVLTPGYRSDRDWYPYRRRYASYYAQRIRKGAPALQSKRLGLYFLSRIGSKTVLCFKSDLHLSQDGGKLPIKDLWQQIIEETGAKLVITTGTAGAIGAPVKLGDVVVGRSVMFDCRRTFGRSPFNRKTYTTNTSVPTRWLANATRRLLPVNADRLPPAKRTPIIYSRATTAVPRPAIVTTDFFAYDTTTNIYGLQRFGAAVEMGDAVLGLVCSEMKDKTLAWFAIRNASDPQIDGHLTPAEQRKHAAQIYERYGYWTSVESAIVSWAVVAGV